MKSRNYSVMALAGTMLLLMAFGATGLSQVRYPTGPVTIVVNMGAGGVTDLTTRALSKAAEKELGQSILVENKPGAGGVIGQAFVLKQKPDGYTLGATGTSTYILIPNIRKVPYDPFTDITDIMTYVNMPFGLAVKADAPWKTFEELIAYVKGNPGKFTFSTAGVGIAPHVCMERIGIKDGLKWTHIPFKSGAEAVAATLGDHTQGVAQPLPDIYPHVKAGKLRMILVLSESRLPDFPNIPTMLEKGYDFHTFSSFGIYAPKGLPEPIRQKLETIFKNAMNDPSFKETMKQLGVEGAFMGGNEYSARWRSQYHEVGKVLRALGLVEK